MQKELDQLKADYEAMGLKIAEIEQKIKERAQTFGQWVPEIGENYFVPSLCGSTVKIIWADNSADKKYLDRGLAFKNEEQALAYDQKRLAITRCLNLLEELAQGHGGVDGFVVGGDNYAPCFNFDTERFTMDCFDYFKSFPHRHLPTRELCEEFIRRAGDDLYALMGVTKK